MAITPLAYFVAYVDAMDGKFDGKFTNENLDKIINLAHEARKDVDNQSIKCIALSSMPIAMIKNYPSPEFKTNTRLLSTQKNEILEKIKGMMVSLALNAKEKYVWSSEDIKNYAKSEYSNSFAAIKDKIAPVSTKTAQK